MAGVGREGVVSVVLSGSGLRLLEVARVDGRQLAPGAGAALGLAAGRTSTLRPTTHPTTTPPARRPTRRRPAPTRTPTRRPPASPASKSSSASILTSYATPDLFFFQAEDGIRDLTVTGVQTCALPI